MRRLFDHGIWPIRFILTVCICGNIKWIGIKLMKRKILGLNWFKKKISYLEILWNLKVLNQMNNKKSKNLSVLSFLAKDFSSKHSQVIIVGGGTGGLAVGNQLVNQKIVDGNSPGVSAPSADVLDERDRLLSQLRPSWAHWRFIRITCKLWVGCRIVIKSNQKIPPRRKS